MTGPVSVDLRRMKDVGTMTKNLTVSLPDDLARWMSARVAEDRRNVSGLAAALRSLGTAFKLPAELSRSLDAVLKPPAALSKTIGSVLGPHAELSRSLGFAFKSHAALSETVGSILGPHAELSRSLGSALKPRAALSEAIGIGSTLVSFPKSSESIFDGPVLIPSHGKAPQHAETGRKRRGNGLYRPDFDNNFGDLSEPLVKQDDINTSLVRTLNKLNPVFAAQFQGAMLCSEERGPDWLRQTAVSLRELLLGLLHTVAPDDLVLPWVTTDRRTQLDQHGHPTRRTKIAWLCGSISHDGCRKFMKNEFESALAVLELLNEAIHASEFPELEELFALVLARVRYVVYHMAKLAGRPCG